MLGRNWILLPEDLASGRDEICLVEGIESRRGRGLLRNHGILCPGRLDFRRGIIEFHLVICQGCFAPSLVARVVHLDAHSRQGCPDQVNFEIIDRHKFVPCSRKVFIDFRRGVCLETRLLRILEACHRNYVEED